MFTMIFWYDEPRDVYRLFFNMEPPTLLKMALKQQSRNLKAPSKAHKQPALVHTVTTKSKMFDTNLPQQPVKQAQSWQTDYSGMQWAVLFCFGKVAALLRLFMFECTDLLLPAHLPENPTLCWDTKRPGSSYPVSSHASLSAITPRHR